MKISAGQIPYEGLFLEEHISAGELDLEAEGIRFGSPLKVKAHAARITNALTVNLELSAKIYLVCSRCLGEFEFNLDKELVFNYKIERPEQAIDLNPDIREEIILGYPLKPLCKRDCKGLCSKCGKNLNEGACNC